MPWEHRENQIQMSWKKLFAADDVSTRKVEGVLMWTLAEDDYAKAEDDYAEVNGCA